MKNIISILTGLKNNLDYSKNFYYTTRAFYPDVEIVFTSYNSTDGTHEWLDTLNDPYLKYYYSPEEKTFSDTFNKCTELATKQFVLYAHNDMVLAPGFIESVEELADEQTVITYTTIEPPIFAGDEKPHKIIKDFGADIETLDINGLYAFTVALQQANGPKKTAAGADFFLCVLKKTLIDIGGLDPLYNPMFCEDDDLILRFELLGLKAIVAQNALCYHFVSKTSRFSDEYQDRTAIIEFNSNRNFIRKWGFPHWSAAKKKYDIAFVVKNGNEEILALIEPYCTALYIDCDAEDYIKKEQPNTAFNLRDKIKTLNAVAGHNVTVSFNNKRFKHRYFRVIEHLTEIITERTVRPVSFFEKLMGYSNKRFRVKIFNINLISLKTYERRLINRK